MTFLGTGTSRGVPIIGCKCEVCRSKDERDKRFRASALVEYEGLTILVDAGPDFRMQMLRLGISHLDAILLTHNHKDHTGGLDDVRSLNYVDRRAAEIYCERSVLEDLIREYPYVFTFPKYPGAPEWMLHVIDERPFIIRKDSSEKELVWVHDVGYHYRLPNGQLIPTARCLDDMIDEAPKAVAADVSLQSAKGAWAPCASRPIRENQRQTERSETCFTSEVRRRKPKVNARPGALPPAANAGELSSGLASPDRSHPRLVRGGTGAERSEASGGAERSEESGLSEPDDRFETAEPSATEVTIIPIRGLYDKLPVLGFRFGDIAYITDMSSIPESEFTKLEGLKHLTLNTVSYNPHHSHFSLDETFALADRIRPQFTWLTHLSHSFPVHEKFSQELKRLCAERNIHSVVQPAYDGLVLE